MQGNWIKWGSNTVVQTKSDSDVIFYLQLISKTFTRTLHLSLCKSRDHWCINLTHK